MYLEKFYGRKSILELLRRRVFDLKDGYRQNIAFLGERHTGKSLILQKFLSDLDDNAIISVYLDLENRDFQYMFYKMVGSILYHYCKARKLPPHDNITLLIQTTRKELPLTVKEVRKIEQLMSAGKRQDAYKGLISLPQTFAQETGMFCVLIFDEFQRLEDLGMKDTFQELGKTIMTQRRCLYIVTSSLPSVASKILSERLSLLFGDFEIIQIDPFDHKTSQEFIRFHLHEIKINDLLESFLIDFTGGQPLSLCLICEELFNLCVVHNQKEIFHPLFSQGVENVLFNRWGVLSRHYEIILQQISAGKGNLVMPLILQTLSEGKKRLKDVAIGTDLRQTPAKQKISKLMELGIIEKNGGYYYIKDKLFKYWMRYVYKKRKEIIEVDPQRQKKAFRENLGEAIDRFQAVSQKGFSYRIIDLLGQFEEDSFQINGRRYKLMPFRNIRPMKIQNSLGASFEVLKASAANGTWYIVLTPDGVREADIHEFLEEIRKEDKPQKCILISFSHLDENARIKALQERMWIWNEQELNTLLNIYDQPFIV